ncbi:unnamed protein product [Caenorhabditis brenneri]
MSLYAAIAGVQIVSSLVTEGVKVLDKVNADPQKRNEEIIKLQKKGEENHQNSLKELKQNKKEFEDLIKTREEAADKRFREQKLKNEEFAREREAESKAQNLKHEAAIKALEKDHEQKMREIKSESKEVQKKAEEEFKVKMAKLEEEHVEEKRKADKEIEKAKQEGKEKIEKVEEELREIEKEQKKQLDIFLEKERNAEREHLLVKTELNQIIRALKLENDRIRREQIATEDRQRMEHINTNIIHLVKTIDVENTKAIIKEFERTMAPFDSVRLSLENIRTLCITAIDSKAFMLTFSVDSDTENIQRQRNAFTFRVKTYNQYLLNTHTSNRDLLETFYDLIGKMEKLINHPDIIEIYTKLPIMVKDENMKEIKKLGGEAGNQFDRFTNLNKKVVSGLKEYIIDYAHASNGNPHTAIEHRTLGSRAMPKKEKKSDKQGQQQKSSGWNVPQSIKKFFRGSSNESNNQSSGPPIQYSETSDSAYSNQSMEPFRPIDPMEKMRIEEMEKQRAHEERMRALKRQMREDEERAEQRDQEERVARQQEAQERRRRMLEEEEHQQRLFEEQNIVRQEEERIRRVEEQEAMRREASERAALDEIRRQQELEIIQKEGAEERRAIQEERERAMEDYDRTMQEQNQQFVEAEIQQEEEARIRKEEFERAQEDHERRKQEMLEELEHKKEEMHQRHRERMHQLREQWEQIRRALRDKLWNDVIQRNWTNRLNTLRSSNQEVRTSYEQMRNHPAQDNSMVLRAIENQKSLMKNEGFEMEKMYNETGKQFLLEIKEAVEDVVSECNRFIYVLENEPSNTHRIEECHSALSRLTMAIPTLAELKHNYNENTTQSNQQF